MSDGQSNKDWHLSTLCKDLFYFKCVSVFFFTENTETRCELGNNQYIFVVFLANCYHMTIQACAKRWDIAKVLQVRILERIQNKTMLRFKTLPCLIILSNTLCNDFRLLVLLKKKIQILFTNSNTRVIFYIFVASDLAITETYLSLLNLFVATRNLCAFNILFTLQETRLFGKFRYRWFSHTHQEFLLEWLKNYFSVINSWIQYEPAINENVLRKYRADK